MLRVLVLAAILASFALACDSSDDSEPTPEPTSEVTTAPTAATGQASDRTGVPEIDRTLDVLFSGDEAAIEALIEYTPTACEAQPEGIGAPPQCRADEAEGTLVDVFPQAQCEGYYTRPEDMDMAIETLTPRGPVLRAVFPFTRGWPQSGEYVAIYQGVLQSVPSDWGFTVILNGAGRIVGIQWGCAQTADALIESHDLADALYYADAPPGLTGVHDLDVILEALSRHNPDSLNPFMQFAFIDCTTAEGIGGPPKCLADEPPGTRVEAFPVSTCEQEYRRRDEIASMQSDLAESALYAVYQEDGRHVALISFMLPDQPQAVRVFIEGRFIVEVDFTCVLTPEEALEGVPPEDVLVGPLG